MKWYFHVWKWRFCHQYFVGRFFLPPKNVHGKLAVSYFMHGISIHEHFSCMKIKFSCMKFSCHDFFMHEIFVRVIPRSQSRNFRAWNFHAVIFSCMKLFVRVRHFLVVPDEQCILFVFNLITPLAWKLLTKHEDIDHLLTGKMCSLKWHSMNIFALRFLWIAVRLMFLDWPQHFLCAWYARNLSVWARISIVAFLNGRTLQNRNFNSRSIWNFDFSSLYLPYYC